MSPVKSPEKLSTPVAGKQDKIVVEKDEAEELPPGWKKEVKRRKTGSGSATKVDRYYTDPVTGYVFRSLKDAQRYIKTGQLGRLAIKPKEPSDLKEVTESLKQKRVPICKSESPARASKQLPSQTKTRQATRLAEVAVDAPPPPSPPDTTTNHQSKDDALILSSPVARKTRQATRQAGLKIDSPPPLLKDSITRQANGPEVGPLPSSQPEAKTGQAGIQIDSPPTLSKNSMTRQATGLEIGPLPSCQPEAKTRQAKRAVESKQPKTRQAIRQAGIKIDSPPPSPPDTRTSRHGGTRPSKSVTPKESGRKPEAENITDKHNQIADLNTNPLNQERNEKKEVNKEHKNAIETRPVTIRPREDQPPKVSVEKHKSPVINPTVNNPIPQIGYGYGSEMKPDSSINFSLNDLWTDPCIEFAVKTLTGAIPVTDLNKVENFTAPLQMPVEDIWTDPCIEFAVKTLTGAIPVGEDDHLFQGAIPVSSSNPQGAYQFSYETGHKNKQQDSVFQALANGGLQKSGKFVNASNGQSSRSRFFQ